MKKLIVVGLFVNAALLAGRFCQERAIVAEIGTGGTVGPCDTDPTTYSLDTNADGGVDLSDFVFGLSWFFQGTEAPRVCLATTEANNVDRLSDSSPDQPTCLRVLGYVEPGDGGGGLFCFDPASMAAEDGGTVFAPDVSVPGRWLRDWTGDLHVTWFGATANAPSPGTSLQAAIDAAVTLKVPLSLNNQVLRVTDTVTIPGPLTLRDGTILYAGPEEVPAVLLDRDNLYTKLCFSKVVVLNEDTNVAATGLDLAKALRSTFIDVSVGGFQAAGSVGVVLRGATSNRFFNCHFSGNNVNLKFAAKHQNDSQVVPANENKFFGCAFNDSVGPASIRFLDEPMANVRSPANNCAFHGCWIENQAGNAVEIEHGLYTTFSDCRFEGVGGDYIRLAPTGAPEGRLQNTRIVGNLFSSAPADGISIGAGTSATRIIANEFPGTFVVDDLGSDTQAYANRNVPNQFPIPNPTRVLSPLGGPHASALLGKNEFAKAVPTSFIRLTIPNEFMSGTFLIDYIANTGSGRQYITGQLRVSVARYRDSTAVALLAESLPQTAVSATGLETVSVSFALEAPLGASTDVQTIDVMATVDSNGGPANAYIRYHARTLNGPASDATGHEMTITEL